MSLVLYEHHDGIAVIALNSDATRNALDVAMMDALMGALDKASGDPEVRCVILTGRGRAFCSGGSFNDMENRTGFASDDGLVGWEHLIAHYQRLTRRLASMDLPTMAAVNGPAYGAGCDIAAMCDIRIAGTSARFAENFIRLGLISGDGGSYFLIRAIGQARAAEMTLTGDAITADKAARWGLVSDVVPDDELMDMALQIARRITANPRPALRMAKRLLRTASEDALEPTLDLAATMQAILLQSDEHKQAIASAVEARRKR